MIFPLEVGDKIVRKETGETYEITSVTEDRVGINGSMFQLKKVETLIKGDRFQVVIE